MSGFFFTDILFLSFAFEPVMIKYKFTAVWTTWLFD